MEKHPIAGHVNGRTGETCFVQDVGQGETWQNAHVAATALSEQGIHK